MTVHFIGAGPGAPDLITVRGLRLVERCPVCLYAGSLVPPEVVAAAPPGARVLDTAGMTLDEIVAEMRAAHARGEDVARLHSGDPSIYGAIAEQTRRLDELAIPWRIVPGVPAFAAAAAAIGRELTLPGVVQSVVLTRLPGRASTVPESEDLAAFAATGATLAIHLSVRRLRDIRRRLEPLLGPRAPVVVVHRASWPDQRIVTGTLADIADRVKAARITRTALVLIGGAVAAGGHNPSSLYDPEFRHLMRPGDGKRR